MAHALKQHWTSELEEMFSLVATRAAAQPDPVEATSIVQARKEAPVVEAKATTPSSRESALEVVAEVAERLTAALEHAELAEHQLRTAADRASEELDERQKEIGALQERIAQAEAKIPALAEDAREKLADCEDEYQEALREAEAAEKRAVQVELDADKQVSEIQLVLRSTNERLFAAETRALEADEDLEHLKTVVHEKLGILPASD